jgi:glyoxylase-like metal-dependent hydrolase (beta-lactamase superfamily II)
MKAYSKLSKELFHKIRTDIKLAMIITSVSIINPFIAKTQENLAGYQKAVQIVNDGMTALGGVEKTNAIKYLYIEYSGLKYMDGQSRSHNKPNITLPVQNTVVADFTSKERLINETADRYPGGYLFHFRTVYTDSTAFSFEVPKMRFGGITELPVSGKANTKAIVLRHLPNFVVKAALEKKQTLRYLGTVQEKGRTLDIVSFPYSPLLTLDLYFDSQTKFLMKYSYYTDHYIHGDQQITYSYSGYRNIEGVFFPTEKVIAANDVFARVDTLKVVQVNGEKHEVLFQKPDGYRKPVVLPTTLKELGGNKNIVMIEGLNAYNPLILNFQDHITMIEAPGITDEAIQMAKKQFPGKPIKYLSLSHYHEDHSSGLIHYIKNGTTILTTPGNVNYIKHFNNATHSIIAHGIQPNTAVVETFEDKKVLSDENITVELIKLPSNSHADELIAYYFPKEKILYQADMIISSDEGKVVQPLIPLNFELYNFIKTNKLKVDTIYGVHWLPIAFKDLEKAIKENKQPSSGKVMVRN